ADCQPAGWRTRTSDSCRKCRRDSWSSGIDRRVRHRARCRRGLANAADTAIAPGLPRDPRNQLDIVLLLGEIHESEFAFGTARAAYVGVHVGVALLHVPFDRSGLAPEKQREGRHGVELVLVWRGREQRRHALLALWPIDAERDAHPVAHRDFDVA